MTRCSRFGDLCFHCPGLLHRSVSCDVLLYLFLVRKAIKVFVFPYIHTFGVYAGCCSEAMMDTSEAFRKP